MKKRLHFEYIITEVCSLGSNYEGYNIGADNGLAPERRKAVIWSNDGFLCERMRHSASMSKIIVIMGYRDSARLEFM